MASNGETYPQNGLIVAGDDEHADTMGELAHAILDDVFYNIIHDIVLKTHREEKIARASSAAIVVEQQAHETDPNNQDDGSASSTKAPHKVETPAALYKDGEVFLKGNPLKTIQEIRCSKCGLPRLLHPTDGNGAQKPDPSVEYCKRRPFIEKKGFDIYGQTFQPEGPGRGKKKQPNPLVAQAGSQDSSSPNDASKPINFPHAKCHHCNTFLPIKRMNNHMAKCIGGGGRDSSRTALWKIQNGNGNGNSSQNGSTPPGSRNGTPMPATSSSQPKSKTSPNKRDADDYESEESPEKKKKKLIKTKVSLSNLSKSNKLKAPKMSKSASQHSSSNLSFEHRLPASDDDNNDDSDGDGEYGTVVVEPKKKASVNSAATTATSKIKTSKIGSNDKLVRKKWLLGRGGGGTAAKLENTPVIEAPDAPAKKNGSNGNGSVKKERAASESSQTLSSPN
ncbi:transcriptional activator [Phlyctema vagabunda]|uniref:Transcriptional activator n=1 Tax=Phlyctema vagabunda TaxID=108571 RepID=A0ABR4PT83_9HELO